MSTATNFKISIKNQPFTVLGGLKCEKLANNVYIAGNGKVIAFLWWIMNEMYQCITGMLDPIIIG